MTVRLVDTGWGAELTDALRADASALRVICPFIKVGALDRLLSLNPGSVQVITRFNLADFADGVSEIAALRILLGAGARVWGILNFTPSFICSARAGRSSPQPASRSRRWNATTDSAWWPRMHRSSRPAGPISTTFDGARETTSCAIRSMPRRKPYPPSRIGRPAGQTNRSRGFRGRCRRCRSAARSGCRRTWPMPTRWGASTLRTCARRLWRPGRTGGLLHRRC